MIVLNNFYLCFSSVEPEELLRTSWSNTMNIFLLYRTSWQPIRRKNLLKKENTKAPEMILEHLKSSGEEHGERS